MQKEEISRLKSLLLASKKKPNEIEILDINDYKEGEFIGEEATSIVRILIKSENEKFAKKELKGFTQKVLQQFFTEGDNLFKNCHPCIIRIIYVNYGDDTHAPWILLKLEPTSLEKAILNNELDENEKNRITAELVLGMRYIHSRNFMYRNLKLSNILLSKNRHVRISDFGPPEEDELEASESKNIGILRFMAPELFEENDENTKDTNKVDVYAFGIILFFIVTGSYPKFSMKNVVNGVIPIIPDSIVS